jgi:hypothetical protein
VVTAQLALLFRDGAGRSLPGELLNCVRSLRRSWAVELGAWDPLHTKPALRVVSETDGSRPSDLAKALRIAPRSATR